MGQRWIQKMPSSSSQSNKESNEVIDMANKKEKDISSRVLSKQLTGGGLTIVTAGSIGNLVGHGWNAVLIGTNWVVYKIDTIDLSGYSLQDKTLFPQGVLMQDMGVTPTGNTLFNVQRATMVSTTPINEGDLTNFSSLTGTWQLPGSSGSTQNLNNILQGRLQYYITLSTFAGVQQVKESTWGTADSTAAPLIWLVDAYVIPDADGQSLQMPDSAFVIPSIIAEEPELEYLMRLSRSLEPVY